jgi:hypothetical protein
MITYLGTILFCATTLAETCQMLTSPTVYDTKEECMEETFNFYTFLGQKYSPAIMTPACVELKRKGEPA